MTSTRGASATAAAGDALGRYRAKRNFERTPEPPPELPAPGPALAYVIQKHWASRLHYDFRLELDGVLLSWAVPKGPCYDPAEKRMAVHVEDHPVAYGSFEGRIPPRQYGAGTVIVWDRGTWEPVGDARAGMAAGKLVFRLHGEKLAGLWELVRIAKPGDRQDPWILFKKRDAWARPLAEYDVVSALPDSVVKSPLGRVEERESREAPEPRDPAEPSAGGSPAKAAAAIDLAAARPAALPARLAPQLATLGAAVPTGGGWALEPKWDGYRILARIEGGRARLHTRNGHDWTAKMPTLAAAIDSLGITSGWLDGEIVVLDEHGAPDFSALQNAIDARANDALVYFVFDLPYLDGLDLRAVPWSARRALLRQRLATYAGDRIRYSPDFDVPAAQMLEAARAMRLEGLVAKRIDAPYVSRRSEAWLKMKCVQRQEFVVVGYTDRAGSPQEVGAMMLAYHQGGSLVYAGNVGTGWDHATGQRLHAALAKLATDLPAVDPATIQPGRWSRRVAGSEHWVRPKMVVEVEFAEWTADGHVRQPVFRGQRDDKPAAAVTREVAMVPAGATAPVPTPAAPARRRAGTPPAPIAAVKISHPDRVIDPSTGLKKVDLVRHYESIAPWLLPHLKDRPVSLVRAPDGVGGELFFQKHLETRIPGLRVLDAALWPGHAALIAIDTAEALVAAAQLNVIEFHTWNSTTKSIDKPDRIVFDLDPGEGVAWPALQEAATLTHAMLDALGLESWLKTSGGKGLHVVVPLTPRLDYDAVKEFSRAVVQHMAATIPQKFVARMGAANRVGKVYIDYLRNGHGQTTAAAYSARARPGLGVSMPVSWDQLAGLKSGAQWTIATAREHLSFEPEDPWAGYWKKRQTLTAALKVLRGASA